MALNSESAVSEIRVLILQLAKNVLVQSGTLVPFHTVYSFGGNLVPKQFRHQLSVLLVLPLILASYLIVKLVQLIQNIAYGLAPARWLRVAPQVVVVLSRIPLLLLGNLIFYCLHWSIVIVAGWQAKVVQYFLFILDVLQELALFLTLFPLPGKFNLLQEFSLVEGLGGFDARKLLFCDIGEPI